MLSDRRKAPRESNQELINRLEPRPLVEEELDVLSSIRGQLANVVILINGDIADSREKSLALTHVEEVMMWVSKAVAARK